MIRYKFNEDDTVVWTHYDSEAKKQVSELATIVGFVYDCPLYEGIPRYGIQLLDREVVIDAYSGLEKKYLRFPIVEAVQEEYLELVSPKEEEKSVAEMVAEIEDPEVTPSGCC